MRYFIDTEFNGFGGDLISIALAPEDEELPLFYEALHCAEPTSWVEANVLPVLETKPISLVALQTALIEYFADDQFPIIVADWPEDLEHLLSLLTDGKGIRLLGQAIVCELIEHRDASNSASPHNAYHDAVALRRRWLAERRN